jgi:hypothetical protein
MANGQDGFGAKWEKGELGKGELALDEMGKKLGEMGMGEMALGEMGINLLNSITQKKKNDKKLKITNLKQTQD